MNKYIDEVIADFEGAWKRGDFDTVTSVRLKNITSWLDTRLTTALTEQERRIKEDIAAKIEEIRTKDRDWPSERLVGLHLVLDEILFLLTPLPSSTEGV